MNDEEFLTCEEVCQLFHVGSHAVYRWAREGRLKPCSKVGRRNFYRKSEVMALIDPERSKNNGASKGE